MDELFDKMAVTELNGASDEVLTINPDTRQIEIPGSELVFGVEGDMDGERKYFACPRIVGNGIDLATCFVRANYRNANGDIDFDLIDDLTVAGDNVLFSWEVSAKVVAYKGQVKFNIGFDRPGNNPVSWHTTVATGQSLEGQQPDVKAALEASKDGIAQLLALVDAQTDAVEAVGAEQVGWVETTGAEQIIAVEQAASDAEAASVAEIEAKGENTLNSIPDDYTALSEAVDVLSRSVAPGIVCEAEGSVITLDDASDSYIQGMKIFGRSTQDGTPTPDAPVEIVSIVNPTVSVDEQTITINRTLPGIPVTSGGNYIDSDGQQWICDEVDLARGVYVQRLNQLWFDGSEIWGTYDYQAKYLGFSLSNALDETHSRTPGISNQFDNFKQSVEDCIWVGVGNTSLYVITKEWSDKGLDAWKSHLNENPLCVIYPRLTPIETPLSETELVAYRSLHTNKPNTTILNDAGAHMAVEYVADTKLYIDKKLAQ